MKIQKELIEWFKNNKRDLPFRKDKDPYSIWVSEIMAQQTRIETMLSYYERWMKDYPTIEALANAPIEKVLKSWEGLGYYNRARKLHEGANQVVKEFGGKLPQTLEELQSIQGIGPYTAGAIGSIAFQLRAPAVDGNVLRVTTRLLEIDEDISKQKTVRKVYDLVYEWMEESNPSDFTEGLMELGALICTSQNPKCDQCPLTQKCLAFQNKTQNQYPKKSKTKKNPIYTYKTLLIIKDDKILLSRDDRDGLMKDFYRLPQYESFDISGYEFLKKTKHVYSHKTWVMDVYKYIDGQLPNDEYLVWKDLNELNEIPLIGAHLKIITKYIGRIEKKT